MGERKYIGGCMCGEPVSEILDRAEKKMGYKNGKKPYEWKTPREIEKPIRPVDPGLPIVGGGANSRYPKSGKSL